MGCIQVERTHQQNSVQSRSYSSQCRVFTPSILLLAFSDFASGLHVVPPPLSLIIQFTTCIFRASLLFLHCL